MKIKVCGLKEPENIRAVAALKPDYMGFIFYVKSPRFLVGNIPEIDKSIIKTGVFVNATLNEILTKSGTHDLQAIQLHGNESAALCGKLKKEGLLVIKAFNVDSSFDFTALEAYETACEFYLFDSKGPAPGGNGFVFDWTALKKYHGKKSFFLSGGIGVEHADRIKKIYKKTPAMTAVDVNSRFETRPGLKDVEKLQQFIKQIRMPQRSKNVES